MSDITDKLAKFVRLLSSDQDGEVVAAAGAIRRVLLAADLDIHDLAKVVERSGLGGDAAPRFEYRDRSRSPFRTRASAGKGWGRTPFDEDEDFNDSWGNEGPEPGPVDLLNYERANYCYQFRRTILNSREAEFVTDMSAQAYIRRLTPRQAEWLDHIWHKCQPFDFDGI